MGTLFHDATAVEHDDHVRFLDGRQAVRDHQRGASPHHFFQRRLDVPLRGRIQSGRRLVENQHGRVFEQCASDGDPLALAPRQQQPVVAHDCVEAIRELVDECISMGSNDGVADFLRRALDEGPIRDVAFQGVVEQHYILSNQCDLAPQVGHPVIVQRPAIQQYLPGADVVEARQEACQR